MQSAVLHNARLETDSLGKASEGEFPYDAAR